MTDDEARLHAIANAPDDHTVAWRIHEYYKDADRGDRTPRHTLYFHIGLLAGIVVRLTTRTS